MEGGCHGDLDVKGQNNLVRVREIAAVAIIEAIAKMRLARGGQPNQVAAIQRSGHQARDLVDIWYDLPNKDAPGRRGPAQIATVIEIEGNVIVRSQGKTIYRRHQEVRAHVLYLVYLSSAIERKGKQ